MMGHLNSFSASGGGNLNKSFPKIQMPGGLPRGGGMLKLRFDWYITVKRRFKFLQDDDDYKAKVTQRRRRAKGISVVSLTY